MGGTLVLSLLLFAVALYFIKRYELYRLPARTPPYPLSFFSLLGLVLTYLVSMIILMPFVLRYRHQEEHLSKVASGWIQIISISFLLLLVIGYLFVVLRKETRNYIFFRGESPKVIRGVKAGIISWLIAYPVVFFVMTLIEFVAERLGVKGGEQVAVSELKELIPYPLLFVAMVVTVSGLVPFLEELLFRGFLQNWLNRYLGRMGAIILTSLIFAGAHFSMKQGAANTQLLTALFVLSLILGFLYEKEKNLFAPIALHMTFNLVSSLGLFLTFN